MRNKLLIFGLICMLAGGILSIMINLANAQTAPTAQDIQNCKIAKDSIELDKSLGVPANQITALSNLYNDTCATMVK
jgi:hypothetical protein